MELKMEPIYKVTERKARFHRQVSYVKSLLRIGGYLYLPFSVVGGAIVLIVAEGLGVAEEVWGA